jgi:hypothetical protein
MIWPLGGKLHQDSLDQLSPVSLAGLLFGDPCPLRWLPAGARRMPRRDSAEPAGAMALTGPFPLSQALRVQGGGRLSSGGRKSKISQSIGPGGVNLFHGMFQASRPGRSRFLGGRLPPGPISVMGEPGWCVAPVARLRAALELHRLDVRPSDDEVAFDEPHRERGH